MLGIQKTYIIPNYPYFDCCHKSKVNKYFLMQDLLFFFEITRHETL